MENITEIETQVGGLLLKFTVTPTGEGGSSLFDLDTRQQNTILRIGKMVKAAGENGGSHFPKEKRGRKPRQRGESALEQAAAEAGK